MDQESWWGSEQFCPADLHATPRNEKILKNWEVRRMTMSFMELILFLLQRDRQMRKMRHVGRWGRRERQLPTLPLLKEGQFEDADSAADGFY